MNTIMNHSFSRSVSASKRIRRLREIVGSEDSLAILIDPDPDAIASAMALRRIFWRRIRRTEIFHINPIHRSDNLAMVRLLRIELKKFADLEPSLFTKWAVVDSQPGHHREFADINFDIIIDHHPISAGSSAAFLDVREHYGATSTIMTEYLKAAKIRPSTRLSTALLYGIKTDTGDFVRASIVSDFNAFRYLYPFVNMNIIKKIESSEMSRSNIEAFRSALERVRFLKGIAHVHMGRVESPDLLVILADFFMRFEEATWSIASGFYEGKLVMIFRNAGYRGSAGKAAQRIAAKMGGIGGGHRSAARAEVPLDEVLRTAGGEERVQGFVLRHVRRLGL
jgi:nanoRNase/pAp phosphatase (c-di-AMP/oligoRNAs hydrolase)